MNPEVFRDIYCSPVKTVQERMGTEKQRFPKMGPIKIVDSSTVTLCLQKYGWAKYVRKQAGIKIHLRLVFVNEGQVYPEKAVITPAKPDDRKQMGAMIDEAGATYVFDRGYADYGKFDEYCENAIGFTTRLRRKAIYEVVGEYPVKEGSPILRDTMVILGNPHKRMKNVLRRLETVDSQGNSIVILTNRFDVSAEEIGDLYRNRWKIELFFKYIKQHLKMTQFYGTTEQAVQNQVYIGLISYLLLILMRLKSDGKQGLLYIHRLLVDLLWEPWNRMMEAIHRQPQRTSKGRQKRCE
jgi:IS4 transposase